MAQLGFDATQVQPNEPFEVIPAGKYKVQIVASEMRPTKDGNGSYLWLELDILEGECQGRKLWDRLNLSNPNQQAVEIAQRTLSAICHATGKVKVQDSEELHFIPMIATVRVRPAGNGYDASNEIRGYAPANGAVSGAISAPAASAPAARPAAQSSGAKVPPWRMNKAS